MKSNRRSWPRHAGRQTVVACLALCGLLLQLLLSIGHVDGPVHRDGLVLTALEKVVFSGQGHASPDHDQHPAKHDCSLCSIAAVVAAGTPPGIAIPGLTFGKYEPAAAFPAVGQQRLCASHYAIRGPPLV